MTDAEGRPTTQRCKGYYRYFTESGGLEWQVASRVWICGVPKSTVHICQHLILGYKATTHLLIAVPESLPLCSTASASSEPSLESSLAHNSPCRLVHNL